jgi:hypothetical protein
MGPYRPDDHLGGIANACAIESLDLAVAKTMTLDDHVATTF